MILLSLLWRLFERMTAFSYKKYKISINSKIPKSQILFDKKSPLQDFIRRTLTVPNCCCTFYWGETIKKMHFSNLCSIMT